MTTTTTVNFDTSGFVNSTAGKITWMEAIYTGNLGSPTNLISGSGSMTLTDGTVSAQRIYIVAGSGTAPTFTTESQIISDSLGSYRYVIYELNLKNSQSDVLDITAINGIGFNVSAQSVETPTPGYPSSYNSGAVLPYSIAPPPVTNSITSEITGTPISNSNAVQTNAATAYNMIYGPSGSPGSGYWPASYWDTYVQKAGTTGSVINDIEIGGIIGVSGGYQLYNYRTYQTTYNNQLGIMLYPVALNLSAGASSLTQDQDWIFIPNSSLEQVIYQPGLGGVTATVFQGGQQGTPVQQLIAASTSNANAFMEEGFLLGFDAGFVGSFGTSPNPNVLQQADLNKLWNFGWNYAYQGQLNPPPGTNPGSGTSLGSLAIGSVFNNGQPTALNGGYYDPYAATVSKDTNVYSWPYTDYLSTFGGTPPTIPLWDPNRLGPNQGANVATLNFTVYADSTTQSGNFIEPAVGYIAPNPAGTFSPATFATTNSFQIPFTYAGVTPDQNTPMEFRIYAPGQKNSDSQGFIDLILNGLDGTNGDWINYQIHTGSPSTPYTVTENGTSGAAGILNLQDVPVVQPGEAWYQFILGSGADATTYNIYAVANSAGQFTQIILDQSAVAQNNILGSPSMSSPKSGPATSVKLLFANQYVTYDPAIYGAPNLGRFSDGPLSDDVLLTNANAGQLANWKLDGNGNVIAGSGSLDATLVPGWQVAATGSFGSVGTTDLLLQNVTATGQTQLSTWTVNGATVTPHGLFPDVLKTGWSVVGTGDFIGAGQDNQILLQQWNQNTGQLQLAFWEINDSGQRLADGNVGPPLGNGWTVAGVGNILGDGRSDVLLQDGQNLAIWEFNSQGVVTKGANINETLTPGWSVAGLGYFSSQTHEDILLQNGNQLAMWEMNGFDVSQGGLLSSLLPGWALAGVGDYNGDHHSDILLQNGTQFAEWQLNGMTVTNTPNVNAQLSSAWNLLGTGNLG